MSPWFDSRARKLRALYSLRVPLIYKRSKRFEKGRPTILERGRELEEQIKCVKSNRMHGEEKDSFTEGKIYPAVSYIKTVGFRVFDDLGESHWIFEPGNEFFDQHFKIEHEQHLA